MQRTCGRILASVSWLCQSFAYGAPDTPTTHPHMALGVGTSVVLSLPDVRNAASSNPTVIRTRVTESGVEVLAVGIGQADVHVWADDEWHQYTIRAARVAQAGPHDQQAAKPTVSDPQWFLAGEADVPDVLGSGMLLRPGASQQHLLIRYAANNYQLVFPTRAGSFGLAEVEDRSLALAMALDWGTRYGQLSLEVPVYQDVGLQWGDSAGDPRYSLSIHRELRHRPSGSMVGGLSLGSSKRARSATLDLLATRRFADASLTAWAGGGITLEKWRQGPSNLASEFSVELGGAYALSPEADISARLVYTDRGPMRSEYDIPRSGAASLILGATVPLFKRPVSANVGIGLTDSAPDFQFSMNVPMR